MVSVANAASEALPSACTVDMSHVELPLAEAYRFAAQYLVMHACYLLYLRPHGVVAGGIMFYSRSFFLSFFLFFLSPEDLRDGSTDREPF